MSTITKDVVLGQKMILVRDWFKKPEVTFVSKVNKTTFLVEGYTGLFYLEPYYPGLYELRNRVSRRQCCRLFHFTQEKWDELKRDHDVHIKQQEEKKQQKDKERQERLQKQQEQIAILKDVFGYYPGNSYGPPTMEEVKKNQIPGIQWMQMNDKGSMAIVTIPKSHINQKWNPVEWKVLVIKMVEGKKWDYDSSVEKLVIETSVTYTTDRSGSFPSCSSNFYATEEEALWESIRYGVHEDR